MQCIHNLVKPLLLKYIAKKFSPFLGSVTFSLTLTICCELLVLCQSLQLTMSEKKVQLLSLSKDIYSPP